MNIKEISEKTGLTKKAIRYYEKIGLIAVSKNPDNDYREYNREHIQKLKMISLLRNLDFSTKQIAAIVDGQADLADELRKQQLRLEREILEAERKKQLLDKLNSELRKGSTLDTITNTMDREFLLSSQLNERIKQLYPGPFGLFVETAISPFLSVAIDTQDKQRIADEIIGLLDEIPPVPEDHPLAQWIAQDDQLSLEKYMNTNAALYKGLIDKDSTIMDNYKASVKQQMNLIRTNEAFREQIAEQLKQSEGLLDLTIDSPFSRMLAELNPDYRKMAETIKQLEQEINMELGYNYKQYLLSLKNIE